LPDTRPGNTQPESPRPDEPPPGEPPPGEPRSSETHVELEEQRQWSAPAGDLDASPQSAPGEVIVVTGTRSPEKIFDAPVTMESVSAADIEERGGTSYLSALRDAKGVDFVDVGINEQRLSARGMGSNLNNRMIQMVDGRLAQFPALGMPLGNFLPTSALDMKAVEVVIGPASALYGPNAHAGVVNVLTKSPWDESGAAISLRRGTQELSDLAVRVAGTVADRFGWKVNASYLTAHDFEPDRAAGTHSYGTSLFEGDLVDDYDLDAARAEGSLYYRHRDWFFKTTYGFSETDAFSLSNAGRLHFRDFQVDYQSVQVSHPRWYAQVTRTGNDSGRTYQLELMARQTQAHLDAGMPLDPVALEALRQRASGIDRGQMFEADLQYRQPLGRLTAVAGAQGRRILPESQGTYLDDGERDIEVDQVGGYLQLDWAVVPDRLRLLGAVRWDWHSDYSNQLSPKATAVYDLWPGHKLRAGYNRAYNSPTVLQGYLHSGEVYMGNAGGFTVRDASGNQIGVIPALEPEQVDAVELGYKGQIAGVLFIDASAYDAWYESFISPLSMLTNPAAGRFAHLPDGELVAAGSPRAGTLFSYQNFGKAEVRGADIGLELAPVETVSISASGSYIDLVDADPVGIETTPDKDPLLLNVPQLKLKGAITLRDLGARNTFVRLGGRFHGDYEYRSGYWDATTMYEDGEMPGRFVADLSAGYDFPSGVSLRAYLLNALDNRTPDVLGAPEPRRLAYLQMTYRVSGLRF
jgi:iron complex outermembrane receptor protein